MFNFRKNIKISIGDQVLLDKHRGVIRAIETVNGGDRLTTYEGSSKQIMVTIDSFHPQGPKGAKLRADHSRIKYDLQGLSEKSQADIKTDSLVRHYINRDFEVFKPHIRGRVLEVGTGERNRYVENSYTMDMDPKEACDLFGNAEALPFGDGSFQTLLCLEVLEHAEDPQKLVGELYRVLAPGGYLFLTTRFCFELHRYDLWRFTEDSLRLIFASFSSVSINKQGNDVALLAHVLTHRKPPFKSQVRPLIRKLALWLAPLGKDEEFFLGYAVVAHKSK